MNITMIDTGLNDFNALGKFLNGVPDIKFSATSKKEKYEWIKEVLNRFNFRHLKKSKRGEGGTVTPKGDGRSFDTDTLNVNISFGNPGPLPPQEIPSEGGDTGGSIPTVDLCDPYQFENNYDQPAGCDPNSCGYELWSCMHDRNRVWAFENNDQCPCP